MNKKKINFAIIVISLIIPLPIIKAQSIPSYIPKIAFERGIGVPYKDDGVRRPNEKGNGFWQGTSIGGFGAGTIERAFNGEFNQYSLKTGVIKRGRVPANEFSVFEKDLKTDKSDSKVLSTAPASKSELKSWNWEYPEGAGKYYALYPWSWFVYDYKGFPAQVSVEQFSPILPNNYKETSYPTGVFVWRAENPTDDSIKVGIMFSWTNMLGWFNDFSPNFSQNLNDGNYNEIRKEKINLDGTENEMVGVVFRKRNIIGNANDGQYTIASVNVPGVTISYHSTFYLNGNGSDVWTPFSKNGSLDDDDKISTARFNDKLAGAICATFVLAPHEKKEVPMVLSWDLPTMTFGSGRSWYKLYTEYFGKDGSNAWEIAKVSLKNYTKWEGEISEWQDKVTNASDSPDWFKMMLFNEMYSISDAGTGWENGEVGRKTEKSVHHFYFLESPNFTYCNTLDLWFYGSFPIIKFWPEIEKRVMLDYANTVAQSSNEEVRFQGEDYKNIRPIKIKGALPHDLGSPYIDPWITSNAYDFQDPNLWRDLNTKFVLLVYRDYYLTKDQRFLDKTYTAVKEALDYMKQFDANNDGLIEDNGLADQTFDVIPMKGPTSYTGGLWLAALKAGEKIASIEKDKSTAQKYSGWFNSAQKSFEQNLWNGKYYDLDTKSIYHKDILLDQLAGPWYAKFCGLGNIIPVKNAESVIQTLVENNFAKYGDGKIGGVTVISPDGKVMYDKNQFGENLVGITLSASAAAMEYGNSKEAFEMAKSIYDVSYLQKGFMFRTPAAWDVNMEGRTFMNMRPLVIWAIEMAKEKLPLDK